VQAHERETVRRLRALGHDVTPLVASNEENTKTPDSLLDGELWEMKSPKGAGPHTIDKQLRRASHQSARLVLDLARTSLDDDEAIAEAHRKLVYRVKIERVLVLRKDGQKVLITRDL
jgi:hypothetical protein